jgi:hypothetical protein
MPFCDKNIKIVVKKRLDKKSCVLTHESKSTSRNHLALCKMLFFHKDIKNFVKKRLEESFVLTPQA